MVNQPQLHCAPEPRLQRRCLVGCCPLEQRLQPCFNPQPQQEGCLGDGAQAVGGGAAFHHRVPANWGGGGGRWAGCVALVRRR